MTSTNLNIVPKAGAAKVTPAAEIETKIVSITPELARQWLETTDKTRQRPTNRKQVLYLAGEMKNGNWEVNGESIVIDEEGNIANGLHRLEAVIESGVTIRSLVTFGVKPEAILTLDQNKPRSLADALSISLHNKYASAFAAAIDFVVKFETGRFTSAVHQAGDRQSKVSPAEAVKFTKQNPGFAAFVEQTMQLHKNGDKLLQPKIFVGLKWILDKYAFDKSEQFFALVSTGSGLKEGSPVYMLRKRLIESRNKSLRRALSSKETVYLTIKAFNYFCEGATVNRLQTPSTMPEIYRYRPAN